MANHVVEQGDCISSIAEQYGFFWSTLWNHADNADLKELRKNPNVLLPDDVLVIPDKKVKEESCATEKSHKFKRKGVPAVLKIRLLNNGQPRKNFGWKANLGGTWQEGKTDGDGNVEIKLAPRCDSGILKLENGTEYQLQLRELDPVDSVSGVQGRLNNLGYDCGAVDGKMNETTTESIKGFQGDYELKVDGMISEEFCSKLKDVYGC